MSHKPKEKKSDEPEWTPEDLREWQIDKRGSRYWQELEEMANKRVQGITDALDAKDTQSAIQLNGELNGIKEAMQAVDLIIAEETEEEPPK